MYDKLIRFFGFIRFVARRFQEDRCSQVAANLTFTTLLALVPILTIVIAVISAFPAFERLMVEVKFFILKNFIPEISGKVISNYMEQFSQNAAGLTTVGILMLAVTALMLMFTIDDAFNTIWRTRHSRPLVHRFLIYWAMLTLGPLLIGISISLTSYFIGISKGWVSGIPVAGELLRMIPAWLNTIAFSLLYLTVPNRFVPRYHALIGGIIAAILFELMKRVFAIYLVTVPTYGLVYGAFASLPIFLLWLYASWQVILVGAVITASLSYWRGSAWRVQESPRQRFHDALRVLRTLHLACEENQGISLSQLRHTIPIGLERLEDLLDRLLEAGVIRKNPTKQYFLVKRPEEICLVDIYRLFVLEANAGAQITTSDENLAALIVKISENMEENLGLTLESTFTTPASDVADKLGGQKTE
ncbi:MAG: YihY family inner membrane protein [Pseudomonadota bacterium]